MRPVLPRWVLSWCAATAVATTGSSTTATGSGTTAPNTSLVHGTPVCYFGGNEQRRGEANIAMLAKMRMVMIEKWEGNCWTDCLASNNSQPPVAACTPACHVESKIVDTLRRVKAINPRVSGVMYLNTLLDFPFYALHGAYTREGVLTVDSTTGLPMQIRNDNGMEGIFVYGFEHTRGQQLYIDAVRNLTATGVVDGFFGDKWPKRAQARAGSCPGDMCICNHECGSVSASQGASWNTGKARVLRATTAIVGDGPYYENGGPFFGSVDPEQTILGNLVGATHESGGDPRQLIEQVKAAKQLHKYVKVGGNDQHWGTDPNDPENLVATCLDDCHARFLLAWEEGAMLGQNGWHADYDRPIGAPLGPASVNLRLYLVVQVFSAATRTLVRRFSSGTSVVFRYDDLTAGSGKGVICWGGVCPPAPPPGPPPPPPPRPSPPAPPIGQCPSTVLADASFGGKDLLAQVQPSAAACCAACVKRRGDGCVQWAWHTAAKGRWPKGACHLHLLGAQQKHQVGTVSGVLFNSSHARP